MQTVMSAFFTLLIFEKLDEISDKLFNHYYFNASM